MRAASPGARRAAVTVACTSAAAPTPPGPGADAALTPAAVVNSITAAYNADDAGRFTRRSSDSVPARAPGAPATTTRGRAALRGQTRRAFAAVDGPRATRFARAVEGDVVIDRERLDGLPGGPRDVAAVLRVAAGRVVRIRTAPAAPRPAR